MSEPHYGIPNLIPHVYVGPQKPWDFGYWCSYNQELPVEQRISEYAKYMDLFTEEIPNGILRINRLPTGSITVTADGGHFTVITPKMSLSESIYELGLLHSSSKSDDPYYKWIEAFLRKLGEWEVCHHHWPLK
jgi:hypothetical protein